MKSTEWIRKRKPTHPGAILREDVLPALGLTQGALADRLGVSRRTVSEVLHERRAVTPDSAIRLGRMLGHSAESYLRMQTEVDVWQLTQANERTYRDIDRAGRSSADVN